MPTAPGEAGGAGGMLAPHSALMVWYGVESGEPHSSPLPEGKGQTLVFLSLFRVKAPSLAAAGVI